MSAVPLLKRPNTNLVTAFCRPIEQEQIKRYVQRPLESCLSDEAKHTMMNKTMYYQMPIYNDEQTGSIT